MRKSKFLRVERGSLNVVCLAHTRMRGCDAVQGSMPVE